MAPSGIELVDRLINDALPKMEGWCTPEKARIMARLIAGVGPGCRAVELGVFGARALVAMGLAVKHCLGGVGTVDGIDPYSATASLEGTNDRANQEWWQKVDYGAILQGARAAITRLDLDAIVHLRIARSQDVVQTYDANSLDVLHQDSNHSEEVSCYEVASWTPKMKPGGVWVFDDTNWSSTKAAQERLMGYHGYTLVEQHDTWGVFRAPKFEPNTLTLRAHGSCGISGFVVK